MRQVNLQGKIFGMLLVIGRDGNIGKKVAWLCRCDCGNTTRSITCNLTSGVSMSCGCVRTKHHGKGTRLYRIWSGMKDRCLNPSSKYRNNYGGRGITICESWAADFSVFQKWALENGYLDNLEIDRRDVNGNYQPDNCRWVTSLVNSRNKRNSKLDPEKVLIIKRRLELGHSHASIARHFGVSNSTVGEIKKNKIWKDVQAC